MNSKTNSLSSRGWNFFRAGGFDQVRIDSGHDLLSLDQLDQKLWVALACPVNNVHFDRRTLSLIDTDNDGRIRAPELLSAIRWVGSLIKNPDDLLKRSERISLASISSDTDEGKSLISAMAKLIKLSGKPETETISLTEVESMDKQLSSARFNGDGIITEDCTDDEVIRTLIRDIIDCQGPVEDRSGKPGINQGKIDQFFSEIAEFLSWHKELESLKDHFPLGDRTAEAATVLMSLTEKIDDFFARCKLAAFDTRLTGGFLDEISLNQLLSKQISKYSEEIASLPLASIEPNRQLPLVNDLNPAWAEQIHQLSDLVITPLLGKKREISQEDWAVVLQKFAPYISLQNRKPAVSIQKLAIERITSISSLNATSILNELIKSDLVEDELFTSIVKLEKFIRLHRDLHTLCMNFVNFKQFYIDTQSVPAIFIAGTLFLDQRSCKLCITVDDIGKHSLMAAMAGTYLVYCECSRKGGTDKMFIVAAFTNGDSENLMNGRNGVFYDRNGNDWDATVVKIIENPIGLRQAFWLPYKNFVRMIETQIAKRASAADTESNDKLQKAAISTANAGKSTLSEVPKKLDIGVVAAIGVAAGAIGTFAATLVGYLTGLVRLGPLAIIGAIIGIILLISTPSMILAYIKLRKRNIGPILDASGWAINAKAKINVPFGAELTSIPVLPSGSQKELFDPYAEKKSRWPVIAAAVAVLYITFTVLNNFGYINDWSGGRIGIKKEISSVHSVRFQ